MVVSVVDVVLESEQETSIDVQSQLESCALLRDCGMANKQRNNDLYVDMATVICMNRRLRAYCTVSRSDDVSDLLVQFCSETCLRTKNKDHRSCRLQKH